MQTDDELFPIAVLMDELKSDDVSSRLNAIKKLSTIAIVLGHERTRDDLVPFLERETMEDEDEVLVALAEELGNFEEYVGGSQYAQVLLAPLQHLATVEEPLVRQKAAESLRKICSVFSRQQIEEFFVPLVRTLSQADWFTSRSAATGLYAVMYDRVNSSIQDHLRQWFAQLCQDDTPMVRREAATNLKDLIPLVPKDVLIHDLLPLFGALASDDQDSVRHLTVADLIAIAQQLDPQEIQNYLGTGIRNLWADKSWRVRYSVADNWVSLATAVGGEHAGEELISAFVRLVKDNEAEVRSAIAKQFPGFCKLVPVEIILGDILGPIKELVADPNPQVRAAFGENLSGLAPILGKDATIEHLLPMFLQMLKDDDSKVRLNIISRLELVNAVIGIELLSQALLPAIVELAEDKNWRVRLAIITQIPLLAKQLGVDFFDEKLAQLSMNWLGDPVYSIREAATVNLESLTREFGAQWAKTTILPRVLQMAGSTNYLYRMTVLFSVARLASVVPVDIIATYIIPLVNELERDPIPNIRFNVAKTHQQLIPLLRDDPHGAALLDDVIKPSLLRLKDDSDGDVRFYASKAIQCF